MRTSLNNRSAGSHSPLGSKTVLRVGLVRKVRSALATSAERRVVCDSFVGKTTEVLDLHVAHHPHGALPLTPERQTYLDGCTALPRSCRAGQSGAAGGRGGVAQRQALCGPVCRWSRRRDSHTFDCSSPQSFSQSTRGCIYFPAGPLTVDMTVEGI